MIDYQKRYMYRCHNPLSPMYRWKKYARAKGKQHNPYNNKRWREVRKHQLAREPLCRSCGVIANHVDHIIPHNNVASLFYDMKNLQTLCKECHNKKTRRGL